MRLRGRIDHPIHNGERARLSGTSTVCSRGFCRPSLAYLSETVAERTTDHVARRTGARDEPIGQAGIGEDLRCLMAWRTAFDNTNWNAAFTAISADALGQDTAATDRLTFNMYAAPVIR